MAVDILLGALNARYTHASLGVRSLRANLGNFRSRSALAEFDTRAAPEAVADALLRAEPRILAMGIYIWNTGLAAQVLKAVRRRAPHVRLVLGGPEIDPADPRYRGLFDLVLQGEGEEAFPRVCGELLGGRLSPGPVCPGPPPDLSRLVAPDAEYSDHDLRTRTTYVESSRGCPFACEYCLSALDGNVRYFRFEDVRAALDRLLARGATRFKFVDRTFNLDIERAARMLDFWLSRDRPGLSVQLEAVPDRFPSCLRAALARFPANRLRLEIGVQTLDPKVSATVGRRLDPAAVEDTFVFLRDDTRVTVHADLIAGLPGEDLAGVARGFNRLLSWRPAEIQLGLLKRLRGAPIARHDDTFGMRYAAEAPYELLSHNCLSVGEVHRIKRFARYWERMYNRGRLRKAVPLLWHDSKAPFEEFMAFSDWAFERLGKDWGIALDDLTDHLALYLREERGMTNARERVYGLRQLSCSPAAEA